MLKISTSYEWLSPPNTSGAKKYWGASSICSDVAACFPRRGIDCRVLGTSRGILPNALLFAGSKGLGRTKVGEDNVAVLVNQDVVGSNIAVDDTAAVEPLDCDKL